MTPWQTYQQDLKQDELKEQAEQAQSELEQYRQDVDTGDYIIVINAEKVTVTGNKFKDKVYYAHSGFPGGLKSTTFDKLQAAKPEMIIEKAVKGMLPRGPLGRAMYRKLKVYAGTEHNHAAQQPQVLDI